MLNEKTTLTLPREWELLLQTQLGTDRKVDRLLPLLELLNDPEHPMSELGQALIDALQRISEDLREAASLRNAHREALKVATETNNALLQSLEGLTADLRATRQESRALASRVEEIHGLMFSPED